MKIFLIRHLPTPGNKKRQYIGRTDEDLSQAAVERFRRQRKAEAGHPANPDPAYSRPVYPQVERIITSPLKRCIQTAELIWPGREIMTEPMLRECDFGLYEGKTYEELKNEPEYVRWMESGGMTAFPEGEDQAAFRGRCVSAARRWIGRLLDEGTQSAAFVVHGGTIMAVLEQLAEGAHDFYRWQAENGGGYAARAEREEWNSGVCVLRELHRLDQRSCRNLSR